MRVCFRDGFDVHDSVENRKMSMKEYINKNSRTDKVRLICDLQKCELKV